MVIGGGGVHYPILPPSQTKPAMTSTELPRSNTTRCIAIQAQTTSSARNETLFSYGAQVLLSTNGDANNGRRTQEDALACDTLRHRQSNCPRGQGIVDSRTKKMHERLYAKVERRKVQRKIDQLDVLMQKVADNNKELYDMYAQRKSMLEVEL